MLAYTQTLKAQQEQANQALQEEQDAHGQTQQERDQLRTLKADIEQQHAREQEEHAKTKETLQRHLEQTKAAEADMQKRMESVVSVEDSLKEMTAQEAAARARIETLAAELA